MTPHDIRLYVALGDSISIDLYPDKDIDARYPGMAREEGLGGPSLLARNHDLLWPEFEGKDLATLVGDVEYRCLAEDGSLSVDLLRYQIPALPPDRGGTTLVTVTAGGNDILGSLLSPTPEWEEAVQEALEHLRETVRRLQAHYAQPWIVLCTVYDPTDGTGDLGDGYVHEEAFHWLRIYNAAVAPWRRKWIVAWRTSMSASSRMASPSRRQRNAGTGKF